MILVPRKASFLFKLFISVYIIYILIGHFYSANDIKCIPIFKIKNLCLGFLNTKKNMLFYLIKTN